MVPLERSTWTVASRGVDGAGPRKTEVEWKKRWVGGMVAGGGESGDREEGGREERGGAEGADGPRRSEVALNDGRSRAAAAAQRSSQNISTTARKKTGKAPVRRIHISPLPPPSSSTTTRHLPPHSAQQSSAPSPLPAPPPTTVRPRPRHSSRQSSRPSSLPSSRASPPLQRLFLPSTGGSFSEGGRPSPRGG